MRNKKIGSLLAAAAISAIHCLPASAAKQPLEQKFHTKDSIVKNGYTLIFINEDSAFSMVTKQKMVDAFFTVYPKEAARYNKATLKTVTFVIDPSYDGVAATGDGVARYNPIWLLKHPEDIDVVTHEVMHIVQAYPDDAGPGWLTEGIADYVRYDYGVNNAAAKWALPAFAPTQHYDNAYRITARFLVWLEKNKKAGIVQTLDKSMRTKTYTPEIWKKLTGSTLDELWDAYAKQPAL
ncbi:basic secretory protein-like protein [Deminuibacter soli]|uniref:Secretory protein n=1 Tax=Deminuibacter soli TaxID=2291815 RepID=A0A3E1NRL3_9BACT|nr:basic secretory protein-like protein [Deminuibacter soli]RFM30579.1 secretory protein [Deminuibacter soli]